MSIGLLSSLITALVEVPRHLRRATGRVNLEACFENFTNY